MMIVAAFILNVLINAKYLYYKQKARVCLFTLYLIYFKGWTLSFLFILRWMLTNLYLVVYRLSYYFINMLNGFKTLIEFKDFKIYFCSTFIICRLNMYLKVLLSLLTCLMVGANHVIYFQENLCARLWLVRWLRV